LVLAGCTLFDGMDCTTAGCAGGITVRLPAMPAAPFKVELLIEQNPGASVAYTYECTDVAFCGREVRFSDIFPTHVIVRVTTTAGVRTTAILPVTYELSYPNGRECGPECKNGIVDAPLPT
jgi:hypothetical protein